MTDLPVWLQEIRDRANKATPGPWRKSSGWMEIDPDEAWHYVESAATGEEITGNFEYEDGGVCSKSEDAEFIIGARMDVPRLVELVAEMARVLGDVEFRLRDLPNPLMADIYLRGRVTDVLAKYHEEGKNE